MTNRLKYTIMVVIMIGIASPIASVFIASWSAQRTIQRSESAQAEAEKQNQEIICYLFGSILDAYNEVKPTTPAWKNVRDAWAHLYEIAQCQPPRKE